LIQLFNFLYYLSYCLSGFSQYKELDASHSGNCEPERLLLLWLRLNKMFCKSETLVHGQDMCVPPLCNAPGPPKNPPLTISGGATPVHNQHAEWSQIAEHAVLVYLFACLTSLLSFLFSRCPFAFTISPSLDCFPHTFPFLLEKPQVTGSNAKSPFPVPGKERDRKSERPSTHSLCTLKKIYMI